MIFLVVESSQARRAYTKKHIPDLLAKREYPSTARTFSRHDNIGYRDKQALKARLAGNHNNARPNNRRLASMYLNLAASSRKKNTTKKGKLTPKGKADHKNMMDYAKRYTSYARKLP